MERASKNSVPGSSVSEVSCDGEDTIFNFESFSTSMKNCISEELVDAADVELRFYLVTYEQLYNFFLLLGGAFQFVAQDVKSKIKILKGYWNEENSHYNSVNNFSTVNSMITYEMSKKLLDNSKYVSGSRTLLRLHRGLDFIRKFLREFYEIENDVRLGSVARQVYDQTLADYHSWVVRNTARVAMQFLPTRAELLNKISQNDEEKLQHILEIFPDALLTVNVIYERVQNIYSQNELLNLP